MRRLSLFGLGLMIAFWSAFPTVIHAENVIESGLAAPGSRSSQDPSTPPGVFSSQKKGPMKFHLSMTANVITSRDAIEKYLAYRAAE